MTIRSTIHLDGTTHSLQLYPVLQETDDHLLLKLAAFIFFHKSTPLIITSPQQHVALIGQDFAPDLMAADFGNEVTLWIECGKTTLHKLDKVTKRFRNARLWMLLTQPQEAKQMADTLKSEGLDRFEIWSFQQGEFATWKKYVQELNDIVGEADERSMNLVINSQMFVTELSRAS